MTEENKNKTRSKLTLKLPGSATSNTLKLKSTEKKLGSSNVQIAIKGRKKEAIKSQQEDKLNKEEFEARFKAISKNSEIKEDLKTHEILNKAKQETKAKQEEKAEEISEEVQEETTIVEEEPVADVEIPNYNIDNFNIRDKIKKSVEETNRQKEERQKLLEKKRQEEEAQRLELERLAIEREKANEKSNDNSNKKSKFRSREDRKNRKQTYIVGDESSSYKGRKNKRDKNRKSVSLQEDQQPKEYKKISRDVLIPELITVSDLSDRMSEKTGDVVKKLFSMGVVVTSNQAIDADTAEIIVEEFGHKVKRVSDSDVENVLEETSENLEEAPRAPVVTIMGHVDHGKTSLLDALRQTDIVAGEHGGITQHIGASRIKTKSGGHITFLDTPGHEAFTEMRSRGANLTDIVVLVVAADDGVKEQTIEAINHSKAANVPIIVAVNKIDKPGCDPSRVKNELLEHEVISEDMGGDVMFVEVSAKSKTNLDKLEEAILLQAEMLDLKAPIEGKSSGIVLESRVDLGKGVVADLLVQKGTLDIADIIVVGTSYGKVRKMIDGTGKTIKKATPSVPVEVLGLDYAPNAGDVFVEVSEERQAREIISYRARKEKEEKALKDSAKSISDIFKQSGKDKIKYLNIIIKSDVHGSGEAISGSILKLNNEEVAIKVIHMATGGISESDVNLAAASDALIIGFNVRANGGAKQKAEEKNIDIRYYSIIYNLVDDLKLMLSGMLNPEKSEEYLGQAEIRQVFKVSGAGKIAGSFVTDGLIKRNAKIRLLRDNVVIHDGILKTLKRFKEDAKEVKSGFECGFSIENYDDIKEGDSIECYEIIEQERSL